MCRESWDDPKMHMAYSILLDVILLVLPVAIMTFSYGKISYTLWSGMKLDSQEMGKNFIRLPSFCCCFYCIKYFLVSTFYAAQEYLSIKFTHLGIL